MMAAPAQADSVSVAVAANFVAPMQKIAAEFERDTGHKLLISSGATGSFYAQIKNGAPYEVLLAADSDTPARLVKAGSAVAASQFTYAVGKLVLWSAQPGLVDGQGAVLAAGHYAHLAIANPKLAPYGEAGLQVIKALNLSELLAPRLVTAESIGQAYQFVATGNAELGFVALSQVAVPGKAVPGSYWLVPPALYSEIRQDAVVLQPGVGNPAAAALMSYLKSDPARRLIQAYGYGL